MRSKNSFKCYHQLCSASSHQETFYLWPNPLKPLDTFGKQYWPRPTLHVSQLVYKITILWKFRLNRSSELGENGKTHSCFRTFRRVMTCLKQIRNLRYRELVLFLKKKKAFHGIIFQEKSITITICKYL